MISPFCSSYPDTVTVFLAGPMVIKGYFGGAATRVGRENFTVCICVLPTQHSYCFPIVIYLMCWSLMKVSWWAQRVCLFHIVNTSAQHYVFWINLTWIPSRNCVALLGLFSYTGLWTVTGNNLQTQQQRDQLQIYSCLWFLLYSENSGMADIV